MEYFFSNLLNEYNNILSKNDKDILKNLNDNIKIIPTTTINQLATITYTSTSGLYRLIKKLGFSGYSDFKYRVYDSLKTNEILVVDTNNYLDDTLNEIAYTHRINESSIKKAAHLILEKNNRYVFGTGYKQQQFMENFSADMLMYGISFINLRTIDDLRTAIKHMNTDSLVIIASLNGRAKNFEMLLDQLNIQQIPIISLSLDKTNKLSTKSNISLYYSDNSIVDETVHWKAQTLLYLTNLLIQATLVEKNNYKI